MFGEDNFLRDIKDAIIKKIVDTIRNFIERRTRKPELAAPRAGTVRNNFLDDLRVGRTENPETVILQKRYQEARSLIHLMTNNEVHEVNQAYKNQIMDMTEKIEAKKREFNMLKQRLAASMN